MYTTKQTSTPPKLTGCTTTNEILDYYLPQLTILFQSKPQFDTPQITQTSNREIMEIIKALAVNCGSQESGLKNNTAMLDNVNASEIIKAFNINGSMADCKLIDCISKDVIDIMQELHKETMDKLNLILNVLIGDEKIRFMAYFINLGASIINYIQEVSSFSQEFYLLFNSMMLAIANNDNNCCPTLPPVCKESKPIDDVKAEKLMCFLRTSVYPEFFRMFIPNCNDSLTKKIPFNQLNPIIMVSALTKHLVSEVFIFIVPMIMGMMSLVYDIEEVKLTSLMNTMMRNLDTKGFLKTTNNDLADVINKAVKSQFEREEPAPETA
jgi:hypothetical protein